MLLFIAFLIVVCLTALGWYHSRDIFSPFFLVPGVWAGILLLYYIAQPDYYPIRHDFPVALVLWVTGFLGAAWAVYYLLPECHGLISDNIILGDDVRPNRTVINAYMVISLLVMPYMLYALVRYGLERGEVNLFLYIRMTAVDADFDKPEFGLAAYLVPFSLMTLIFAYGYVEQKWFRWLAVGLNIVAGLTTMSKTTFFIMVIVVLYVQYRRKKVKLRTLGLVTLAFLAFSVWFQFMRSMEDQQDNFSVLDMLETYTMSPCVAFDYYAEAFSASHVGEHVFRFYYAVAHALGSDIAPADNILKFVGVPELTNTYTILYPFYTDFGLPGVFVFAVIYGLVFGFIYRRGERRDNYYFVLYACFVCNLILQFVQENIFSNLSLTIQYCVLLLIPFLVGEKGEKEKQKTLTAL